VPYLIRNSVLVWRRSGIILVLFIISLHTVLRLRPDFVNWPIILAFFIISQLHTAAAYYPHPECNALRQKRQNSLLPPSASHGEA